MARLLILCATASIALPATLAAQEGRAQIELVRQPARLPPALEASASAAELPASAESSGDDAFGAQVILKRQEKVKRFSMFAETSGTFTSNVALVRRDPQTDEFFVASGGAAFTQRLGYNVRFDSAVRLSLYRYDKFRELDFQSVDASGGFAWAPPQLRGAEASVRYAFTELTTGSGGDEFYRNHALLLGLQKVVPFSRAHSVYFGVNAQWSWTEPAVAEREEYVAFAGYHLQATRRIDADLFYRYGRYAYTEAGDRRDNNHSLSVTLRYAPVEWAAISATSFFGINRARPDVFDYDVWNGGVTLQMAVRF